jgi:hypothetical protein
MCPPVVTFDDGVHQFGRTTMQPIGPIIGHTWPSSNHGSHSPSPPSCLNYSTNRLSITGHVSNHSSSFGTLVCESMNSDSHVVGLRGVLMRPVKLSL